MQTLNSTESAEFLKINIETFYERAASGEIPATKEGRSWVCVDVDLVQYLRTKYQRKTDSEGTPWGSISSQAATTGGIASASKSGGYAKALGLPSSGSRSKPKRTAGRNSSNSQSSA
jgi:hypothetical protein